MTVPQPILDALNQVQSDAEATAAAKDADARAGDALAAAQHSKDVSGAAVLSATGQQKSDLAALIALAQSTYGG